MAPCCMSASCHDDCVLLLHLFIIYLRSRLLKSVAVLENIRLNALHSVTRRRRRSSAEMLQVTGGLCRTLSHPAAHCKASCSALQGL